MSNLSSENSLEQHLIMIVNSSSYLFFRRLAGRRWRKENLAKTSRRWVRTRGKNNWRLRREIWVRRSRFFYRIVFYPRPFFILPLLLVTSDWPHLWYLRSNLFHFSCRWSLIESEKRFNSSSSYVLWLTLFISINKFIQNNNFFAISLNKTYEIRKTPFKTNVPYGPLN